MWKAPATNTVPIVSLPPTEICETAINSPAAAVNDAVFVCMVIARVLFEANVALMFNDPNTTVPAPLVLPL